MNSDYHYDYCSGTRKINRVEQVYNISSEEYVTFDGMAKLCAQAAGMAEPQIVHYDPKSVEVPDGFPKAGIGIQLGICRIPSSFPSRSTNEVIMSYLI